MDYFVLMVLGHLMSALSALAPLLITTALLLTLVEAFRESRPSQALPEGLGEQEVAATSINAKLV